MSIFEVAIAWLGMVVYTTILAEIGGYTIESAYFFMAGGYPVVGGLCCLSGLYLLAIALHWATQVWDSRPWIEMLQRPKPFIPEF